jgi:serine protease Do
MKKNMLISGAVALVVSLTTIGVFMLFQPNRANTFKIEHLSSTPGKSVAYTLDESGNPVPLDFTQTAQQVMDAVVNIKSTQTMPVASGNYNREIPDPFRDFFGDDFFRKFQYQGPQQPNNEKPPVQIGTGSGVLIQNNGLIVTNNHVVANSDDIEVTLHDNRTFKAKVVGTDPSTDLALIQIESSGLPFLKFVN